MCYKSIEEFEADLTNCMERAFHSADNSGDFSRLITFIHSQFHEHTSRVTSTELPFRSISSLPGQHTLGDMCRVAANAIADGQRYTLNAPSVTTSTNASNDTLPNISSPNHGSPWSTSRHLSTTSNNNNSNNSNCITYSNDSMRCSIVDNIGVCGLAHAESIRLSLIKRRTLQATAAARLLTYSNNNDYNEYDRDSSRGSIDRRPDSEGSSHPHENDIKMKKKRSYREPDSEDAIPRKTNNKTLNDKKHSIVGGGPTGPTGSKKRRRGRHINAADHYSGEDDEGDEDDNNNDNSDEYAEITTIDDMNCNFEIAKNKFGRIVSRTAGRTVTETIVHAVKQQDHHMRRMQAHTSSHRQQQQQQQKTTSANPSTTVPVSYNSSNSSYCSHHESHGMIGVNGSVHRGVFSAEIRIAGRIVSLGSFLDCCSAAR